MADIDAAQNPVEDTTVTEQPAVEDQTPNEPTTEDAEATQPEDGQEGAATPEDNPDNATKEDGKTRTRAPRAERAISKLSREKKELEAERDRLLAQTSQQGPHTPAPNQAPQQLSKMLEGKESITPEELDQIGQQYMQQAQQTVSQMVDHKLSTNEKQQQARVAAQQLDNDIEAISKDYEVLNPGSDAYDAELDEYIANEYQKSLAVDPTTRLKDYTNTYFKNVNRLAEKNRLKTENKITQQKEESALTPNAATTEYEDDVDALADRLEKANVKF